MNAILGIIMIYSFVHMIVIYYKAPADRTTYEKIVSIVGIVSAGLLFIAAMFS